MCCAFAPEGTGGRRITDITVALHLRNKHMYENVLKGKAAHRWRG